MNRSESDFFSNSGSNFEETPNARRLRPLLAGYPALFAHKNVFISRAVFQ
jgi:hypothetical protein